MLLARPEDFMKTAKNFNIQIRLRVRVSPDHFQRKLDLARCRLGGGNQPGAGDGISKRRAGTICILHSLNNHGELVQVWDCILPRCCFFFRVCAQCSCPSRTFLQPPAKSSMRLSLPPVTRRSCFLKGLSAGRSSFRTSRETRRTSGYFRSPVQSSIISNLHSFLPPSPPGLLQPWTYPAENTSSALGPSTASIERLAERTLPL